LKEKLATLQLRPETLSRRIKDLKDNQEYHARAIQKVIDEQMEPTVAQQMNAGGGGRAVFDLALKRILGVCPL
jgi:ATP-dependent Clp protease ATP-binding subunit ClpA